MGMRRRIPPGEGPPSGKKPRRFPAVSLSVHLLAADTLQTPRGVAASGRLRRMGRRAVVTGVGVVSSIGTGVDAFWDALAKGVSGASVLELEGEPPTPVCRVEDF